MRNFPMPLLAVPIGFVIGVLFIHPSPPPDEESPALMRQHLHVLETRVFALEHPVASPSPSPQGTPEVRVR